MVLLPFTQSSNQKSFNFHTKGLSLLITDVLEKNTTVICDYKVIYGVADVEH